MDFGLLSVFVTAIVFAAGAAIGWVAVNAIIIGIFGD